MRQHTFMNLGELTVTSKARLEAGQLHSCGNSVEKSTADRGGG